MHAFSISGGVISLRNSENLVFLNSINRNLVDLELVDSLGNSLFTQLDLVTDEVSNNSNDAIRSTLILDVIEDVSFSSICIHSNHERTIQL